MERGSMKLAKRAFAASGIYGLLVMGSVSLLQGRVGLQQNWATTAFLLLGIICPVLGLLLATGAARMRMMLIPAFGYKLTYGIAAFAYVLLGRAGGDVLAVAFFDIAFGCLFLIAYLRLRTEARQQSAGNLVPRAVSHTSFPSAV